MSNFDSDHKKYIMKIFLFGLILMVSLVGCKSSPGQDFVTVADGTFQLSGKPYYFIGTNYWYGAILGSQGKYGNRERLLRELDHLSSIGVKNLRVLAGAEGPDGEPFRVTPALQLSPGVYNDDLLDGLDFLLSEMKKRGQYAILFLNNSWDWTGGYSQYLNWNGYGPIPYPNVPPNTWPQFMAFSGQFNTCEPCIKMFEEHIRYILGRTNRYSGVKYTEDPVIMTWEIGNEPRAFSDANIPAMESMIKRVAALLQDLDRNHLVTTGTEGRWGCENNMELYERIHADPNIDYLTMHIWPKNWSWLDVKDIKGTLASSIEKTNTYMDEHLAVAERLHKPLVLEEFGLPRDRHGYTPEESTVCRDEYYRMAFDRVIENAAVRGPLAGCNIWAYSGEGRPAKGRVFWQPGDDYLGDPPQEEQGLNSVFDTDTTIELIAGYNRKLNEILKK
jgi:mannan endo-1,4-beta-mannosidase